MVEGRGVAPGPVLVRKIACVAENELIQKRGRGRRRQAGHRAGSWPHELGLDCWETASVGTSPKCGRRHRVPRIVNIVNHCTNFGVEIMIHPHQFLTPPRWSNRRSLIAAHKPCAAKRRVCIGWRNHRQEGLRVKVDGNCRRIRNVRAIRHWVSARVWVEIRTQIGEVTETGSTVRSQATLRHGRNRY